MNRRSEEYAKFTEKLNEHTEDRFQLSFQDIDRIVRLPECARTDRYQWKNKGENAFQKSWTDSAYRVADVDMTEQKVTFEKVRTPEATAPKTEAQRTEISEETERPRLVISAEEKLKLTTPPELLDLEKDAYGLVCLNRHNSDIVEACIHLHDNQAPSFQVMHEHFDRGDQSFDAYKAIIKSLSITNSTRSSDPSIEALAAFCANPENHFMIRLEEGDRTLPDEMAAYSQNHGGKKETSLSSKICRYLNEWQCHGTAFAVFDSVVRNVLPYYLAYYRIPNHLRADTNLNNWTYDEFYTYFSLVREQTDLDNHLLDHLLWYAYRSDPIRASIAKKLFRKYKNIL